jgi:hypothetical protein
VILQNIPDPPPVIVAVDLDMPPQPRFKVLDPIPRGTE